MHVMYCFQILSAQNADDTSAFWQKYFKSYFEWTNWFWKIRMIAVVLSLFVIKLLDAHDQCINIIEETKMFGQENT